MSKKLYKCNAVHLPVLLLLVFIWVLPLRILARDFTYTYGGQTITYTVLDENAKTVQTKSGASNTAGNSVSGNLILPFIVSDGETDYILTSIGSNSFYGCQELTEVVIPNSVTSIGNYAFQGCTGIKKSAYPANLSNPFNYRIAVAYTSNTPVVYEDGILFNKDRTALLFAFYKLDGDYIIPTSVTVIENSVFYGCI